MWYNWNVDLKKFCKYLREKYNVDKAYYFLGAIDDSQQELYENVQTAGFILVFREHSQSMLGKKKGNVDTDIVFSVMQKIADGDKFDKVVLVSGDGDYFKMVKYLVDRDRFCKLLTPNRHSTSSLYRVITPMFVSFLDDSGVKRKIEYKKINKKAGSS